MSTGETFNFELVSPERKLISEPASMVVIPGEEGDFGVLPNHSPLVATIRPGVIEVHAPGAAVRRIFIAGGFADVSATNCTVLAEEAVNVADLKQADLEQSIRNLTEDLAATHDVFAKGRIQHRLHLAQYKLAALNGKAA